MVVAAARVAAGKVPIFTGAGGGAGAGSSAAAAAGGSGGSSAATAGGGRYRGAAPHLAAARAES